MPSRRSVTSRAFATVDCHPQIVWAFHLNGVPAADWAWLRHGAPPLELLDPVRRPRSSELNRHIPVTAYSMTNGDFVSLESGLEN
jgi:hypothetical protein